VQIAIEFLDANRVLIHVRFNYSCELGVSESGCYSNLKLLATKAGATRAHKMRPLHRMSRRPL
jgi:hypothetical protein